jgi:hypothetical protein
VILNAVNGFFTPASASRLGILTQKRTTDHEISYRKQLWPVSRYFSALLKGFRRRVFREMTFR